MTQVFVLYEFQQGPWGGGNQFLRALTKQLARSGNLAKLPDEASVVLVNSHHWGLRDLLRLFVWKYRVPSGIIVLRVDGPISVVRGSSISRLVDFRIQLFSRLVADGVVFQSNWSASKSFSLGIRPRKWTVITNAPDPDVFFAANSADLEERPLRVVVSSWSSNAKKGTPLLEELLRELEPKEIEVISIGNLSRDKRGLTQLGPQPTEQVATVLRSAHVFLALSSDDPCSNSLIEGIHCGLVPFALDSGGHPEIVKKRDFLFANGQELLTLLKQPLGEMRQKWGLPDVPGIAFVATEYLEFCRSLEDSHRNSARIPVRIFFLILLDAIVVTVFRTLRKLAGLNRRIKRGL